MSDGNWSDKRIVATNVVGGSLTAVLVAVLIWIASSNYTEIRVEAENYAKHYSESTVDTIEQTCLDADLALRIKCETEIVNATREANHDAKDLNAQRQSAYWGFWTACFAGAGFFLSIVGVVLIWTTFNATREANDIAKKTAQDQLRPWVVSFTYNVEKARNTTLGSELVEEALAFTVWWRNEGSSPAIQCQFYNAIRVVEIDAEAPLISPLVNLGTGVIGPNHQSTGSQKFIFGDELIGFYNRTHAVFLYGRVNYRDSIGVSDTRVSETTYKITFAGFRTDGHDKQDLYLANLFGPQNTAT